MSSVTKSVVNLVIDRIDASQPKEEGKEQAHLELTKVDINPSFKAIGHGVTLASFRYFATRSWKGGDVFNRGKEVLNHFLFTPNKKGKTVNSLINHSSVVDVWIEADYEAVDDKGKTVKFHSEKIPLIQLRNWIELAEQVDAFDAKVKKDREALVKDLETSALPDTRVPLPKKEETTDTTNEEVTPTDVELPDFGD